MKTNNEDPTNAYNTKKSTNHSKLECNSTNFHAFISGNWHTDNLYQLQNMLLLARTGTLNKPGYGWMRTLSVEGDKMVPPGTWEKSGTGWFCWDVEDEIWIDLGGIEMHGRSKGPLWGELKSSSHFCAEKAKIINSFVRQINFIYFWCIIDILESCTVISNYLYKICGGTLLELLCTLSYHLEILGICRRHHVSHWKKQL